MGDRASIIIKSKEQERSIQLYGHWAGTTNLEAVEIFLNSHPRLGDAGYFAAGLFKAFTELNDWDGNLNFGIHVVPEGQSLYMGWEDNPTVIVDADTGTYEVNYIEDVIP